MGSIAAFFIPESPKYLFKKGMIEETAQVLKKIAKVNGRDITLVSVQKVDNCFKQVERERKSLDLFQTAGSTINNSTVDENEDA